MNYSYLDKYNDDPEYRQLLETIYLQHPDDFFPLLENAEKNNKKLSLSDSLVNEIVLDNIIAV